MNTILKNIFEFDRLFLDYYTKTILPEISLMQSLKNRLDLRTICEKYQTIFAISVSYSYL